MPGTIEHVVDDVPSSPELDSPPTTVTGSPSQVSHSPGDSSPSGNLDEEQSVHLASQKKKKKKPKRSAKAKDNANTSPNHNPKVEDQPESGGRPPVLCISRNKHWRYISSYHGPWLQLPQELLESLLLLNLDPAMLSTPDSRLYSPPPTPATPSPYRQRDKGFSSLSDYSYSPPESPGSTFTSLQPFPLSPLPPPPFPNTRPGKPTPPPIDPGVFRSVANIRRLIDEAAELSVRAASGLSAAELGSMRGGSTMNASPWAAAQTLGINPMGPTIGGGRNVAMSAMRIHRLRALAVQKLAQAYKADEIASSVMVMQGGTVFDDIAERVLKYDPNDLDAKYVHFFHEKIPSRQLADSTTTKVLDELIAAQPQHLEYYRTRGIVHCFRDEYSQATKDFTHALKEARAVRKTKAQHCSSTGNLLGSEYPSSRKNHKRRKPRHGQAPPDGTSVLSSLSEADGGDDLLLPLHPSALPTAPDPIEPQLLFLRGAAYLQHAVYLIEHAVLELEGVKKVPSVDGAELKLCYIENGKYGGVEIGNPDGPLGKREGEKCRAYRKILAGVDCGQGGSGDGGALRNMVEALLRKSIRDHERFMAHFDSIDSATPTGCTWNGEDDVDIVAKMEYAFLLSESTRPGNLHSRPLNKMNGFSSSLSTNSLIPVHPHTSFGKDGHAQMTPAELPIPATFTTYHPLLVESHFSVLICQLMLADFASILPTFMRTALVLDGLEGYPVFLPPRSMGQAEFVDVLERLANGWSPGGKVSSHLLGGGTNGRGKGRLAIEVPLPRIEEVAVEVVKRVESPVGTLPEAFEFLEEGVSSTSSSSGATSAASSRKNSDMLREHDVSTSGSSRSSSGYATPTGSGSTEDVKATTSSGAGNAAGQSVSLPARTDSAKASKSLESLRILLAPVLKRQKERADAAAAEKAMNGKGKGGGKGGAGQPAQINVPLHGPRVEVILAWLGAVHLPELEEYA